MKLPGVTFSKDALVTLLLNHVEKLLVSVIGLLALFLAWNGVSALRLKTVSTDRQPEALVRLTNETMQHIDAAPNPPAEAIHRSGELTKAIDRWRPQQVSLADPPDLAPLSRPTAATVTMRGEPQVFPIEDLRAVTGVALIKDQIAEQAARAFGVQPTADPSAMQRGTEFGSPDYDEPVRRFEKLVPCVVLVGLVPAAKQLAEFRRALGTQTDDAGRGQQVDVPRWGDFVVERTTADAEDWKPIRPRLVGDQGGSKPLPERFLLRAEELARADGQSGYVAGLPSRLYQPWGLDTIHPWFLEPRHKWRLERSEQIAESPVRLTPADFRQQFTDHAGHEVEVTGMKVVGAPQRTGSPDSVFMNVASDDGKETFPPPDPAASAATPAGAVTTVALKPVFVMASDWQKRLDLRGVAACTLRVVPAIDGGLAVAQVIGITPLNEDGTPGVEQRDPRVAPAGGIGPGFGPGGEGAMPSPMMAGGGAQDEGAEYRLFRFVDDTVEFGKTYRYRVKLELANPNWGLDPKLLASPKSAETELLSAESASSAPVLVPAPYVMVARDAIDGGAPATPSTDDSGAETKKPVGPKPLQLGKTQVEVSFVGPTWRHMRGKRPEQGYDYFDYAIEHVIPVEPGNAVLWKRSRKAKARDKTKSDSRAAKAAEKPRATDPTWSLLSTADVGRDLLDFRGRQASDGGPKEATAIPEPVELALLRFDGSLEVVTAADSQHLLDAFQDSADGMPTPMGPGMGPPGREGPLRYDRPVP